MERAATVDDLVFAKALAQEVHAGQSDQAGVAYIRHVESVAAAVAGDRDAEIAAWLHDAWEDHPHVAPRIISKLPAHIVAAIDILRRNGQPSSTYYARVRANPLALKVKIADVTDNSRPERLALLPPDRATSLGRRYDKARQALGMGTSHT